MAQNNSVDMSQYREQQELLTNRPLEQTQTIQNKSSDERLEHIAEAMQALADSEIIQNNNILQSLPQHQHENNLNNEHNNNVAVGQEEFRLFYFRILLDYSLLFYYFTEYISRGEISTFASIWLIIYGVHWITKGSSCKFIGRGFVSLAFAWLAGKWLIYGSQFFSSDEKIFILIYLTEMIPFASKFCCVCCVSSIVCFCMTCCSCFYCVTEIKKSFSRICQKWRYRKLKENLCKQDLTTIEDRQCPICLQTGNSMNTLNCHHSFHPKCLQAWINAHNTCPVCRNILY